MLSPTPLGQIYILRSNDVSRENKTAVLADCVCGLNRIPRYCNVYNRLSDTLLEYETRREALGSRIDDLEDDLGDDLGD